MIRRYRRRTTFSTFQGDPPGTRAAACTSPNSRSAAARHTSGGSFRRRTARRDREEDVVATRALPRRTTRKGAPAPGRRPAGVGGPALASIASFLGAVTVLLTAAPAAAHTALESSSPADGSRVKTAPTQITLDFTEPVRPGVIRVDVRGPGGGGFGTAQARATGDKVIQPLRPLTAAGMYLIEFRVVALDGDPLTGTLEFTLDAPAGTETEAPQPGAAPPTPVIRATPTFGAAANRKDDGVPAWGIGLGVLAAGVIVTGATLIGRQVTRDLD
ncbi:MAG: hypothetical protein GEV11_11375 [Streptosporangiales bacterium]|nr:hypothetical protein [Streptosporangiales bacterium]